MQSERSPDYLSPAVLYLDGPGAAGVACSMVRDQVAGGARLASGFSVADFERPDSPQLVCGWARCSAGALLFAEQLERVAALEPLQTDRLHLGEPAAGH